MWVLWWGLVPGGITSAAPLQYPQRTDVRPHQAGGMHSLWHGSGQGFTEHICWWNKHRGERKIPRPKPRGFTPHSPALSTFKPPNNPRKCQTPVSQPKAYKSRRHMACNSLLSSQLFSCFKEKKRIPLVCHKQISTKSRSLSDSRLCENKHLHLWLTGLTTVVIYSLFEIQVFPIQLEHGLLHIGAVFW